jgi:chromosome segregation ATPase
VEAQLLAVKDKAKQLLQVVTRVRQEMSDAQQAEIATLVQGKSLQEIQDLITAETARAEMNLHTDPRIVQQYDTLMQEVNASKATRQEKEHKLQRLKDKMHATKTKWERQLGQLVDVINTNFSTAFAGIGCAGEVRLTPHDDYDKWGIDILVKFRETEQLTVLDAQRQSGGERSVSTILYMMSLQEIARTPFRVVDEINQGMDPRNERIIHRLMTDVACRDATPQYFLITPKLLSGLEYNDKMTVLCIYNGEWLPDGLDLKQFT